MALNKVEICGVNTARLPILTNEEKDALFIQIRQGNADAREQFIKGNLRLVLSVIRRFSSAGENVDDLFQIGCIGLIKAIDHFNTELGVRFSTYAVPMIIGEIRRFLRDNNSIRVSRSLRDTAYKAIYAREMLLKKNQKEPSITEVASEVGISREDMLDIYEIRQRLEGIAAERAAAAISDDTLREMKETLGLQKFYIESEREPGENSDQIKNLDSRFHELLYQSCGSRPFTDTLISLHKKIIKYRKASITKHSRAVHALEEHTAIYTALAAHDGKAAAEAALRHVANARANIAGITQKGEN